MEKSGLAVLFIFIIIVLAALLMQLMSNNVTNTKRIGSQLMLGILMNVAFLISLFVGDYQALKIIHALVMICESWICYLFLLYTYERIHSWQVKLQTNAKVSMMLILLENLLILTNAFTEMFFKYNEVSMGNSIYVTTEWSWLSVVHLAGCGFIMAMVVIVMIRKARMVARVYRLRYLVSSIVFALGAILMVVGRLISGNTNIFSVIIVSMGIMCTYYIYFQYPLLRAVRMKTFAINNMCDPVLMFDYNDNLQVYNDAAEEMLGVYTYYPMDEYIRKNELHYTIEERSKRRDKEREFTRSKIIDGKTYLIHGQELWDKKERFVGTLIVYTDISGQERLKDEATLYATRDQLTGLWNRDYFFEIAGKTIRENPEEEFLMVATDIYHFKLFNEILGTSTGDDLLLAFAQAYREHCRRKWVFSRIGGDRFALLLPKSDFVEERFLQIVHGVLERKNYSMKVHCYTGVYEIVDPTLHVESMYDRAFMAVESMKGDMQKEIAYYQEEILHQRIHETTTLDELDRALLNDEFVIYLQPQLDLEGQRVVSAEALIRWNKPGRGIVFPGEFIPIFENHGMIAKLDYYVWELACRQLAQWKEEGRFERSIAVNISAKDFYLSDLYESITGLVEKYGVNPAHLKLEITETAFVLDVKKQMELVRKLQEYGFIIEIDDFGSGYSSLNSLKEIEVDLLKMDLKFFEKTGDSKRAEKIVSSVITLANDLGMPVIAEGVETAEDVEMVKAAGCQMVQGYYYAKPMPVADFEKYLETYPYGDMKAIIEKVKK